MQQPFQCLACLNADNALEKQDCTSFLLACGPRLLLLSLERNEVCSEWSPSTEAVTVVPDDNGIDDGEQRPSKKPKLASRSSPTPMIINLAVSPNKRHFVAVTDDKCLHVFGHADGSLFELSQRSMPKRPCAVQVLPDNETIICGDKFGDVYSLPLLPKATTLPPEQSAVSNEGSEHETKAAFKPSATNLTVHTKRNRRALEAQLKQRAFTAKKEPLKFEHKLLLGHVSMLTDMIYASHIIDGKPEGHIVTADRDEHIRVSRGPPQAHIIEGYCLGHKEYISKLCLVPGTNWLISGGGDDWIGIWDWPTFTCVERLDISHLLNTVIWPNNKDNDASNDTIPRITQVNVSGLYILPHISQLIDSRTSALIVLLERVPAIFITHMAQADGSCDAFQTVNLPSPPIDVACLKDGFLVALDGRDNGADRIQAFKIISDGSRPSAVNFAALRDTAMEDRLTCLLEVGSTDNVPGDALDGLLYGVANLRKRRGWPPKGGSVHEEGEDAGPGGEEVIEDEDGE